MDAINLCLVIEHSDGSLTAWNSGNEEGVDFSVGDKVELLIENSETSEKFVAPCEVSYISNPPEGETPFAILFSHEEDTTEEMEEALSTSGWSAADEEMLSDIDDILSGTNPVAKNHWMYLITGPIDNVENIRIWKRLLEPEIPELPFFGERFFTQLFFSDLAEGEFSTSKDASEEQKEQSRIYVDEIVNLDEEGNLEVGFPAVVFQVGKVDYGHAQISMYVKDISPFDDFSLAADGWEAVTKDELDPVEELIPARIDLAMRTRILLKKPAPEEEREAGVMHVSDYELVNPTSVPEAHYWLLPSYLVEHVQMQKELDKLSRELGGPAE